MVLLCDFHREQAWDRWLNKRSNGVHDQKETILGMLRDICDSETVQRYEITVNQLQNSDVWNAEENGRLRNWLSNTWLPCYKVII